MASNFNTNTILMGTIDHFCLVCEAYLKSEDDIISHIGRAVHKKALAANLYVDSYKNDRIRKIKTRYFCEFCNILMTTLAKVKIHVKETDHMQHFNDFSIKRVDKTIIVFDDVAISERSWNGLHDNCCTICNVEYDNANIHKTQTNHVLNLIQTNIEFENRNVYRKVDQSIFQCLTCDLVLALSSMTSHWDAPEHKNNYEACRNANRTITRACEQNVHLKQKQHDDTSSISGNLQTNLKTAKDNTSKESNDSQVNSNLKANKGKILDSLSTLQKHGMLVNFETETAHCKKCTTSLTLDFELIEKHIENHKNAVPEKNAAKPAKMYVGNDKIDGKTLHSSPVMLKHADVDNVSSIENLVKVNNMKCNNKDDITCMACNKKIPYSINSVKYHITKTEHKINLQKQNQNIQITKNELKKVTWKEFVKSCYEMDESHISDIVINEQICISCQSFTLLFEIESCVFRCHACEENFIVFDLTKHISVSKHTTFMENCFVVTELENEFIREVRPDMFHCAFCNHTETTWENMKLHVKTMEHRLKKNGSASRLLQYSDKLKHFKMMKNIEETMRRRFMDMLDQ